MRTHTDDDIINQAAQPDIPYLGAVQLMDVADTLGYTYDDYVAFARAAGKHCYPEVSYQSHREHIKLQAAAYLNDAVTDFEQKLDKSILGAHWA